MDRETAPAQSQHFQSVDVAESNRQGAVVEPQTTRQRRSRLRWLWLPILLLIGVVIWLLIGRGGSAPAAANKGRTPVAIPVVAAKAVRGDIGVYLNGLGAVTPLYTVTVHTRVDGQLMTVNYREGQMVRKGDLLAELDPRPFQAQLTQAEGQLLKDQASLANARVDLARYQELIKRNAVAEQVLATQQSTVAQLEGAVKFDQGQVDAARVNLIYCRITSPIDGRVGLRLVDPGNIVHAADSNGLLVITQVQPISVIFTIPEDQLGPVFSRFHAGQHLPVAAYNRDQAQKLSDGQLSTIDNQIDPTTGTLKLRALFDNRNNELFPNQFVNARMLVQQKKDVTLVPTAAVQRNAQNTFVWLVKPDNTVTVHPVTVGTTEGQRTEITSGLAAGDVVVTTGVDKLQEGAKVNAQLGIPGAPSVAPDAAGSQTGAAANAGGSSQSNPQNAPNPTSTGTDGNNSGQNSRGSRQ